VTGPRVVVVGDVMTDVKVAVEAPFSHASDTPSTIRTSPGGAASNQAVWISRSGVAVEMVAAVGEDPFGVAALEALRASGVATSLVVRVPGTATGVVVALVERDGQRSMLTDRGANLELRARDVEAAEGLFARGAHLHLSGYCLLDAESRPAGSRALELARAHAAPFSLDACSAGPLAAFGAAAFLAHARGASVLFCNEDEARVLVGDRNDEALARELLAASGASEVVVTLGSRGAVVAAADGQLVVCGPASARVADTTGAGDALSGTYLARRLWGAPIADALAAGAAAAGHALDGGWSRGWAASDASARGPSAG
jgi:sugar/nucleoside kinase (ribokinase family)